VKTDRFKVSCFLTRHRIPCWGFKFEQVKAPRRINIEKARIHNVPAVFFDRLKAGDDFITAAGKVVKNATVTDAAPKPKSYAFCADNLYHEELIAKVSNVDILYHETTYLKDLETRAAARFHATTHQAATIAKKANVKRLIIGHFSSKYDKLDVFELEAKEIFPDTELAIEGATYYV
jgi:ribonuclease Z